MPDPVALTRELVAINTINPPGNEGLCASVVGQILQDAGFEVRAYDMEPGRTNLVATLRGGDGLALCYTGHLDTVPLGSAPWEVDPFAGETADGKLYGRGSTDMKSGVAAMVTAAVDLARLSVRRSDLVLVITAAEETGCLGAAYLAKQPEALSQAGLIIVGEPTGNYPMLGHKGALWLDLATGGKTAHGAMPDLGDNAIYKIAELVAFLRDYQFDFHHPLLGRPTLNVGTIAGGENINSVPDWAKVGVDIRTVSGGELRRITRDLTSDLDFEVKLEIRQEAGAVASDPDDEWVARIFEIAAKFLESRPEPRVVPYFTDAGELTPRMGTPPTLILGPGEADQLHRTNEYCVISRIESAAEIYREIGTAWLK